MFEQGLAYILKYLLGEYVEDGNLFQDKIQIGVWSGLVILENLILKKTLFDMLDVPIALKYGFIGRLEVRIPWANLGIDPVSIIIDKIHLLVAPTYEWKPGATDRRLQAVKQAKLTAAELFASKRATEDSNSSSWSYGHFLKKWFLTSFLTRVIEHIQITVREVHIRYEDHLSCPTSFSIGFCLESLLIQSRNGDIALDKTLSTSNKSSPIKGTNTSQKEFKSDKSHPSLHGKDSSTCFKLVQMNHLSVYWNPVMQNRPDICTLSFIGRPLQEVQSLMSRTIAIRTHQLIDRPKHHYLLQPLDVNVILDVSFNPMTGVAKTKVKIFVPEVAVQIEDRQFREIISLSVNMANFAKLEKFSEFRPQVSVHQDPKGWWRYAIQAVIIQVNIDRNKSLDWKRLIQRIHDKLVYIELWKSKLVSPPALLQRLDAASKDPHTNYRSFDRTTSELYQRILADARTSKAAHNASNKSQKVDDGAMSKSSASARVVKFLDAETLKLLRTIEYHLDFEDIILFRSLAEKKLTREVTYQSWMGEVFSWLSGGKSSAVAEEDKAKLFAALQYDPEMLLRGGVKKADPDEVVTILAVHLSQGSITVALSPPEISNVQKALPFLQLNLEDLTLESFIMGNGSHVKVDLTLQTFEAFDLSLTASHSCLEEMQPSTALDSQRFIFRRVIACKVRTDKDETSSISSFTIKPAMGLVDEKSATFDGNFTVQKPLLSLKAELEPPNIRNAEAIVTVEFEELQILLNPFAKWAESLATFFVWPESLRYWSEMEMSALNQMTDVRSRVDAKLEYMMNNHSNVQFEARIKAPVIVIADGPGATDTDVLVVDLGLITFHTEKLAKAVRQLNLDSQSQQYFTSDVSAPSTPPRGLRKTASTVLNKHFDVRQQPNYRTEMARRELEPWRLRDFPSAPNGDDKTFGEVGTTDTEMVNNSRIQNGKSNDRPHGAKRRLNEADETNADDYVPPKMRYKLSSCERTNTYASTINTINTNTEGDAQDNELFDIFQLQVSQIEVFLIKMVHLHSTDAVDLDRLKTTIVDKFEITTEIKSSVLPWDTTLPPVKLLIDIPELNVQLSESKLKRLYHFANEILGKSKEIGVKLQAQQSKEIPSSKINASKAARKLQAESHQEATAEKKSGKSTRSRSFDLLSQSESFRRYDQSVCNESDMSEDENDDDDNESFFSIDEYKNEDFRKHEMDKLKSLISQRESERVRILSDIRVCEADTSKLSYQLQLNDALTTCETDLKKLNSNYVDMLISTIDLNLPNWKDDLLQKGRASLLPGLKDIVDSFALSSETALKDELLHKRDLIHASVFKTKINVENPTNHQQLDNKELAFVRVNLGAIKIDILCIDEINSSVKETDHGSNTRPQNRSRKKLGENKYPHLPSHSLFRLKLAGINFKLRHRSSDSKVTFVLREVELEDFTYASSVETSGYVPEDAVYLLSSEPSTFNMHINAPLARKYIPNGSTDFIKFKYELQYNANKSSSDADLNSANDITTTTFHSSKITLGFLGFNFDHSRLARLLNFVKTSSLISNSCESTKSNNKSDVTNISEVKPSTGDISVSVTVKLDCLYMCLPNEYNVPVLVVNVWSQQLQCSVSLRQIQLKYKIADIGVYNAVSTSESSVSGYSRQQQQSPKYDSCSAVFFRQREESNAFPQFTLKVTFNVDTVSSVKVVTKVAPLSVKIDLEFIYHVVKVLTSNSMSRVWAVFSAAQSTTTPTANVDSPLKLLDSMVITALDVSNVDLDISLGAIYVFVPTSSNDGMNLRVREARGGLSWGDNRGFYGIEFFMAIKQIELFVLESSIVEGFDCMAISLLSPSTALSVCNVDIDTMQPKNLSTFFGTSYPPAGFISTQEKEWQISISFSPIRSCVNEQILSELFSWMSYQVPTLNAISKLTTPETSPLNDLSALFSDKTSLKSNEVDLNIKFICCLYEISITLESNESHDVDESKGTFSTGSSWKLAKSKNNSVSTMSSLVDQLHCTSTVPRFRIMAHNLIVRLQTPTVVNVTEQFEFTAADMQINISVSIHSFDVEFLDEGNIYRRILCTQSTVKYDDSSRPSLHCNGFHEPHIGKDKDHNVMEFTISLSPQYDLDVDIELYRLHFTLVLPALQSLLKIMSNYSRSVSSIPNKANERENFGDGVLDYVSLQTKLNSVKYKNRQFDHSSQYTPQTKAHPTSTPMSEGPSDHKEPNVQDFSVKVNDPGIVLCPSTFRLPYSLKSFNLKVSVQSCGLWIPTDCTIAHTTILAASADVCLNMRNLQIDWEIFSPSNSVIQNDIRTIPFLQTEIEGSGVQLFFAKSVPKDVFRHVRSLKLSEVSHFHHNTPMFGTFMKRCESKSERTSFGEENLFVHRSIVFPFDTRLNHQLLISIEPKIRIETPNLSGSNLNWRQLDSSICLKSCANIQVGAVEVQQFMDFRPLMQIFNQVMNPLVTTCTSTESAANNHSTSWSKDTVSETRSNKLNQASIQIETSLLGLIAKCSYLSQPSISFSLEKLTVFVINDVYLQPVSVARIVLSAVDFTLSRPTIMSDLIGLYSILPSVVAGDSSRDINGDTSKNYFDFNTSIEMAWSLQLSGNFRIDYYNQILIATEPLVEPFTTKIMMKIPIHQEGKPCQMVLILNQGYELSQYSNVEMMSTMESTLEHWRRMIIKKSPTLSHVLLHVEIGKIIDINITTSFIELLFNTIKSFEQINNAQFHQLHESSSFVSTVIIRNDSGLIAKYWTKDSGQIEIPFDSEVPIQMEFSNETSDKADNSNPHHPRHSKSVSVVLHRIHGETWLPLRDVSLEGLGSRLFTLEVDCSKKINSANIAQLNGNNSKTFVVLELASKRGIKSLQIRSTIKIINRTTFPFIVQVVIPFIDSGTKRISDNDVTIISDVNILWESVVPANGELPVPANYCNQFGAKFYFRPEMKNLRSIDSVTSKHFTFVKPADVPLPVIYGLGLEKSTRKSFAYNNDIDDHRKVDTLDEEIIRCKEIHSHTQNSTQWRKRRLQERGLVDTISYCHWLNFRNSESEMSQSPINEVYCNVNVTTKGAPRRKAVQSLESCWLSSMCLEAPVKVSNLLACEAEVLLIPSSAISSSRPTSIDVANILNTSSSFPTSSLLPGQSWDCMSYHSTEDMLLSVKLNNDMVADGKMWSGSVFIPGCRSSPMETVSLSVDVKYKNDSKLVVMIDVTDVGGSRVISLYVPFWVVACSFMPLQIQHSLSSSSSSSGDRSLNGCDELAADQLYEIPPSKTSQLFFNSDNIKPSAQKVRGTDGIVLGPGMPSKGLADVLKHTSPNKMLTAVSACRILKDQNPHIQSISSRCLTLLDNQMQTSFQSGDNKDSEYSDKLSNKTYRMVQCGYSNKEKMSTTLRFRSKGTNWSGDCLLNDRNLNSILIKSNFKDFKNQWNKVQNISPDIYSLCSSSTVADAPFQRTKLIVVVDKTVLINSVGQTIEVRQINHDSVFSLNDSTENPIWWKAGEQLVQIRLAQYGWSWSGKFAVDNDFEIPIRLRNNFDNTVFFVLVHVVKQGPRIFVVFKGGDKISPYRFENHTLETFQIRQLRQTQFTNLLPYHCCAYAWDEPLASHSFTISISESKSQAQSEWLTIGTFDFEKLQNLNQQVRSNILMRVVAQGPTRTFQIFDTRSELRMVRSNSLSGMNIFPKSKYLPYFGFSEDLMSLGVDSTDVLFKVTASLNSIGLSLIDKTPQELLYATVTGLRLEFTRFKGKETAQLEVDKIQVDNQLWATPYPCLFHPWISKNEHVEFNNMYSIPVNNKPFFSLSFRRDFEYEGIYFLPEIRLCVMPISVQLEGAIIMRVLKMAATIRDSVSETSSTDNRIMKYSSYTDSANNKDPPAQYSNGWASSDNEISDDDVILYSHVLAKKALKQAIVPRNLAQVGSNIYVQRLEICEVKIRLSFNPVISGDSTSSDESLLKGAISAVLLAIGSSFAKIDNCPLSFQAFKLNDLFASGQKYAERIISHYTLQAIGQAYLVVGSSELLGNPVRLIRNLGLGVWDFLSMPTIGLFISPEAFLRGVLGGTSSLIRRSTTSLLSTFCHFAASLQVGLIALGAVDLYPSAAVPLIAYSNALSLRSSSSSRQAPASLIEGMLWGLNGLAMDPINGYRVDGLKGFLVGSAKGCLGLLGRPLFGLLSSSLWLRRYSSASTALHRKVRSRPVRFFSSSNQPLKLYSIGENVGLELLSRVDRGEYRSESYVWHARLLQEKVLIVTKERVLLLADLEDRTEIIWQCLLANILSVDVDYVDREVGLKESEEVGQSVRRVLFHPDAHELRGDRTVHIFHTSKTSNSTKTFSSSVFASTKISRSKPQSLIVEDQTVEFAEYETIVQFLLSLLKYIPTLLTTEVVAFLRLAGVKVYESVQTKGGPVMANEVDSTGVLRVRKRYSLTKRDLEVYNNSSYDSSKGISNSRSSSIVGSPKVRSPLRSSSSSIQSPVVQLNEFEDEDLSGNSTEG